MLEQIIEWTAWQKALFLVLPFWLLLNMFFAFWKVKKQALGGWKGNKYCYNTPLLIFTSHITPGDDEKVLPIKFSDAEPKSFVWYKVEYDGGLAKVCIDVHENNAKNYWAGINRNNQSGGIRINKKKEAKLVVNCPNNSDQTTARVYMLYWEVQ